MRRKPAFTQSDLTRAVKAAQAAGMAIGEVVLLPTGEIRLRALQDAIASRDRPNDFDRDYG